MRLFTGLRAAFLAAALLVCAPAHAADLTAAARATLQQFVSLNTSNPPGNEAELTTWAAESLKADGVDVQLLGPSPERQNLLARVISPRKNKAGPLLIVAHIDVVGVEQQPWTTDPFALTEQDGFLYGRGVIDNKGMAAACVEILRALHRDKKKLKRDVVLLLAADEEAGGKAGTGWLLANHPDLLAADLVLNEGGDVRLVDGTVAYVGLQTTEKLSYRFTLVSEGPDGHASMPLRDNAIARLGSAVAAAHDVRFPMRTSGTTQAFAAGAATTIGGELGAALQELSVLDPGATVPAGLTERLAGDPFWGGALRTTCVPTLIDGGTRSNALPARAEATLNCRLLPDESLDTVSAALTAAVAPFRVTVEAPSTAKVSPVSPEDGPFFGATRKATSKVWPSAVVTPFMSTGGTDCRRFRNAGAACYGLLPFPLTAEDERRMHGTDERVGVAEFDEGVRFLEQLVKTLTR
jgi:acetylornithine deacetylase/succinyl-diaminopimelate desuccinylase-like protein